MKGDRLDYFPDLIPTHTAALLVGGGPLNGAHFIPHKLSTKIRSYIESLSGRQPECLSTHTHACRTRCPSIMRKSPAANFEIRAARTSLCCVIRSLSDVWV